MKQRHLILPFIALFILSALQSNSQIIEISESEAPQKPKLVVGIVIDQMPYNYINKFGHRFKEGGFERFLNQGFVFKNAHYNHIPTVTACGHATIYTGTTPSIHGIIGNSWFDYSKNNWQSNVGDPNAMYVGNEKPTMGGASPHLLKCETILDQLKLSNNSKSKTISISFKDRGAILPGGFMSDGSYWFDSYNSPGFFITSDFFVDELPEWVSDFNHSGLADQLLDSTWNTLYPIETYIHGDNDNSIYENTIGNKETPTFPYVFKELRKTTPNEFGLIINNPLGNSLLTEFAQEAIKNENLGADDYIDFINISYSSTDYIGHTFGPNSVEIEDTFLRLDMDLANLFQFLDESVGENNYVVFLTSDHGVGINTHNLHDLGLPSGVIRSDSLMMELNAFTKKHFGTENLIQQVSPPTIYLNHSLIEEKGLNEQKIRRAIADLLITREGIRYAYTADDLNRFDYNTGFPFKIQNGFYPQRSGDIQVIMESGQLLRNTPIDEIKGAQHFSPWNYDSNVPVLWYGTGIQPGSSSRRVEVIDLVPTLSMMLKIDLPSCASGSPLLEILDQKNVIKEVEKIIIEEKQTKKRSKKN